MNTQTITLTEFEALAARGADWTRMQHHEVAEETDRQVEEWGDDDQPRLICVPHAYGWASKTSLLGDVKIIYAESFSYDRYDRDSLTAGTSGMDEVWVVEGIIVTDDDGDVMDAHVLADYLTEDFSAIDYSALEIGAVDEVDVDDESGMETHTLEIDNAPSLRFRGERLAVASSTDNCAMTGSYSCQAGRWTELALYKTSGGKYVCHQIGRTLWDGERDRFSGAVCESEDDVMAFFGHRWLAKELYVEAGIDASTLVD